MAPHSKSNRLSLNVSLLCPNSRGKLSGNFKLFKTRRMRKFFFKIEWATKNFNVSLVY